METSRLTIRNISIGSAFKVGAVLSALIFALLGIFIIILPGFLGASLLGAMLEESNGAASGFRIGLVGSVFAYGVGTVLYAIFGGIAFAIYALFYNIVAALVGGIEIDLS
ncbi:MAG: DUF3566 domain-containing protein [Ardenticatenaceae bacterium]